MNWWLVLGGVLMVVSGFAIGVKVGFFVAIDKVLLILDKTLNEAKDDDCERT